MTTEFWAAVTSVLTQIVALSTSIKSPYLSSEFFPKFRVVRKITSEDRLLFRKLYQNTGWIKRWTDAQAYLLGDITLPLKSARELKPLLAKNNYNNQTEKICREVSLRRLSHIFKGLMFDLSVAINIANVGVLRFDDGALFADGHSFAIPSVVSQCEGALEFSLSSDWPERQTAGLQNVFDWYRKLNGTTAGHSNTPIGRATCAFTYLFHPDPSRRALMDLVWSLAGIEALLGEADQSRRLITDKLLLLFPEGEGSSGEIRKLIRAVYDFRSRMLHGNRNISSRRLEMDDDDLKFKKYVEEESNATNLSILLLSQLILHCHRSGHDEITTKLVLTAVKK